MENKTDMDTFQRISEDDFRCAYSQHLEWIADAIRLSGLTIAKIASLTRMKWDTVKRASKCLPINTESEQRIMLAIKKFNDKMTN